MSLPADQLAAGTRLQLNPQTMALTVSTPQGNLLYTPLTNSLGKVNWACEAGKGTKLSRVPESCN